MTKNMKILVTGCNGLIGNKVMEDLSAELQTIGDVSSRLMGTDMTASPHREKNYLKCDISNLEELRANIGHFAPFDAIVHLAGDSRHDAPWESVIPNNIIGTRNVYQIASEMEVERVVFASSNHTGGLLELVYNAQEPSRHTLVQNPSDIPHTELKAVSGIPHLPDGPYGLSKVIGEEIAVYYALHHGITSVCLRIGSVLEEDKPLNERHWSTFLSQEDAIQLIAGSLLTDKEKIKEYDLNLKTAKRYGVHKDVITRSRGTLICYGISNNQNAFWDIADARLVLGYDPKTSIDDKGNMSTRTR